MTGAKSPSVDDAQFHPAELQKVVSLSGLFLHYSGEIAVLRCDEDKSERKEDFSQQTTATTSSAEEQRLTAG